MSREHRVLEGLCDVFPLVPRPLLLCEDDAVLGVPFILMEYRSGLVVRSTLPDQLAAHASDLSEMLVDILVSIHRLVPEEAGLGELGRPEGFLERTVAGWAKRADVATDHIPPAAVGELATWLGDNLVPDGAPTLIHNDFKLNNVILTEDDPTRAKAVIDWDMTTRGDPLFDLATLLSYWVELGDPPAMHELLQMPTAQQGFLTRQQVAELYAERTGRDLSDFVFHRVLAMFKLGVVFLQLYARYRRGTTTDERFADFARRRKGCWISPWRHPPGACSNLARISQRCIPRRPSGPTTFRRATPLVPGSGEGLEAVGGHRVDAAAERIPPPA